MTSDLDAGRFARLRGRLNSLAGRGLHLLADREIGLHQAAVVRIGTALVCVVFLLREYPNRRAVWGDLSPWTPEMAHQLFTYDGGFSILLWSPGRWWFESVYLLTILVGLLVVVGWRTRISVAVFAVLVLSIQFRSVITTDGGDNVIQLLLVYLVFTRCGRLWSLDARRRARGAPHAQGLLRQDLMAEWGPVADRIGTMVHNCAMFVIAAQVCLIYATAGLTKVQGSMWQDGTALWYVLHLEYLRPLPALNNLLASNALAVLTLTYLTVLVQTAFPFCVFHRRLRHCLLLVLIVEHLGIAVTMGLPFFSLMMIVADSVFVPTWILVAIAGSFGTARRRLFSRRPGAEVAGYG